MMAYPGNGEESNLPECGQNNVHGSGAHAGLPTETADSAPLTDPKQLSTREFLNCSAQEIIDDLNSKRKRDAALLEDFKKTLDMHCTAAYNSMEAAVYNMYDRNNATIQDKLHELFEVLERTAKQEAELEEFKSALAALYSDIQGAPL